MNDYIIIIVSNIIYLITTSSMFDSYFGILPVLVLHANYESDCDNSGSGSYEYKNTLKVMIILLLLLSQYSLTLLVVIK